ncbi:hypothetical protein B0T21DRAFT_366838 [Apiosordaria backusii]|uniref:Secreted protein n=1 Tax=Apiosordaria backusii TaxID=314023 RepID=A0AA40BLJ3_9PEZI|nr:hypothetical protein B0T21DRAFT_366838 [Apiosordaria backusii]
MAARPIRAAHCWVHKHLLCLWCCTLTHYTRHQQKSLLWFPSVDMFKWFPLAVSSSTHISQVKRRGSGKQTNTTDTLRQKDAQQRGLETWPL